MQLYSPDLLFLPIVINVNELQSGAVLAVGNINFILLFLFFLLSFTIVFDKYNSFFLFLL